MTKPSNHSVRFGSYSIPKCRKGAAQVPYCHMSSIGKLVYDLQNSLKYSPYHNGVSQIDVPCAMLLSKLDINDFIISLTVSYLHYDKLFHWIHILSTYF
jgi:hypothetical protein